ncbi:LuxR C-terminal-related transcriptional regulator [Luteithermobacter gelatinilyticus]|uniref:LuxR C-terminal-related transcriptional regulator n=1 Tax=Luteithermobacter gelatinilyticus TaxID=2582913 RepID=UPI001105B972|nr:LuxR C-terminal-related transcriptional regulator [Luteithermobacter gelatinilyticus]
MTPTNQEHMEKRYWLIRAKLRVPRQQVSLVPRPHLLSLLDEALGRGLALVVAPAGFGKTTLLAQWRESLLARGTKVGWITLDEGDADVHQLIVYMIFALAEAGLEMGALEKVAEQGDIAPRVALASILECIAKADSKIVLVLDDYHRLDYEPVDHFIDDLIAGCPPNFTLVINSRNRPALNLPHYMAAGQAREIGPEQLRFSREETRAAVDAAIDDAALDILFDRTEGWAVAVQLARLVVRGDYNGAGGIGKFHGHSSHIATYLTDQVVGNLSDDIQDFLIKTSILERFNAPLADAIRESNDSWDILKRLEPLHALLVPLEDASEWFRYHHLFAECLEDLLRRRCSGAEVNALHSRASLWFEQEGYVSEAVRHARLAGDLDRCAHLIEEAGGWELILFGGIGYLRNLLRNIPERDLPRFPRIQIARSYLALKDGEIRLARAYLDAAENNPLGPDAQMVDRPGFGRDLLNIRLLMESYEDRLNHPDWPRHYKALEARISPADGVTLGVLHCIGAMHYLANGAFNEADAACREAMRSMRMANSVLGLNYAYLHAGLSAFYQGRFQLAEASFWEAYRLAEDNFGADSGLKFLASILLSALFFWRGGLADEARQARLSAAFDYVEKYDGWLDIYATVLDIHSFSKIGDQHPSICHDAISRCARIAEERGIVRLPSLVEAHLLLTGGEDRDDKELMRLAHRLERQFPVGCWKKESFAWRGYQVAGQALAFYYEPHDRARAIVIAGDLVECCRGIGARFHLIQALILRAILLDRAGDRAGGLTDILAALEMAAPEKISQPFLVHRSIQPLLRAAQKHGRAEVVDMLTQSFIGECLEALKARNGCVSGGEVEMFSPREIEVLEELSQNLSNKEIARALDMTEHTVKFHLKNIYKKLGVERRAQAIAKIRSRNIVI